MKITGKFKVGLVLAGMTYTHFELRDVTVADMVDAEQEVGPGTVIAFNTAMAARQLVHVSNAAGEKFEGPFTMKMLSTLHPVDYRALRDTQMELDQLGEAKAGGEKKSGTQFS